MSKELIEIFEKFNDFKFGQEAAIEGSELSEDLLKLTIPRRLGSIQVEELIPSRVLIIKGYFDGLED